MSTPSQLDAASKCYCFNDAEFKRVVAYLLDQINAGGGGGGTVQDMQVAWTPTSTTISPQFYFQALDGLGGAATSFTYSGTTSVGISIQNDASLTSISFPNLTSFDLGNLESFDNAFANDSALTSFSAPLLTYVSGLLAITNSPLLTTINLSSLTTLQFGFLTISNCGITSLNLSSLVTAATGIQIINCSGLVSINLSSFVPTNGQPYGFSADALNAATVNQVLARCVANAGYVSGTINLNGGTNAAPSGQGIADKATLIGRGVFVNTN